MSPARRRAGDDDVLHFVVTSDGARLDAALSQLSKIPRAQIRRWIEEGRVTLAGRSCRPSQRVSAGQAIVANPPDASLATAEPEAIALTIVYEDADLIVVDKAPGMVVHPAPGHMSGTLVNALLYHCSDLAGVGGVLRPGIVHRLDKGTSGLIVAAKNDACHAGLSRQFHDHSIRRRYRAFVRALPGAAEGRVDRPIGRHHRDRKRMSVRTRSGREAHTAWRVLQRFRKSGVSELEVFPETGRTHQIRVHLASAGLPIVGDTVYGKARQGSRKLALARPALHAEMLGFEHPKGGAAMLFEVELPADLAQLRRSLLEAERES